MMLKMSPPLSWWCPCLLRRGKNTVITTVITNNKISTHCSHSFLMFYGSFYALLLLAHSHFSLSCTSYVCSYICDCSYSPDRSFVLEHGIFLVRNYEKMRDRQALLLREEVTEREKENKEDGGSSQSQKGDLEDTSTKSGPAVCV